MFLHAFAFKNKNPQLRGGLGQVIIMCKQNYDFYYYIQEYWKIARSMYANLEILSLAISRSSLECG